MARRRQTKILGSVTYREAIVLPAGAKLEIRLEDAGRTSASGALQSDAAAAPVATETVDAGGRGSADLVYARGPSRCARAASPVRVARRDSFLGR
jgi:hypothetical protein